MFGKKILSLIGLLFIGSQVATVSATECKLDYNESSNPQFTITNEKECANGYYAVFLTATSNKSNSGSALTPNDNSGAEGTDYGILIKIDNNETNKCSVVDDKTGFFVSGDGTSYISRTAEENNQLTIGTIAELGTECGTVGNPIKNNGAIELCLESGVTGPLAADDAHPINYILEKKNVFTTASLDSNDHAYSHIVVKADSSSITFDGTYGGSEYCVYGKNTLLDSKKNFCSGSVLNRLYSCTGGLCYIEESVEAGKYIVLESKTKGAMYNCVESSGTINCDKMTSTSGTGLFAFKKVDDDETYYTLIDDFTDLTTGNLGSVVIFDCDDGDCKATTGYVKYGNGSAEPSTLGIAECATAGEGCTNYGTDKTCPGTGKDEVGNVLLSSGLQLCITDGDNEKLVGSTDFNGKVGILEETTLYQISSDANIIGVSQQEKSYVSGTNLLDCENGTCETRTNVAGYYLLVDITDKTEKFYSCSDSTHCSEGTKGHGYYINYDSAESKKLIVCTGSANTCSLGNIDEVENCGDNAYEIIKTTGGLKYCKDSSTPVDLSETAHYYPIVNVASTYDYPNAFTNVGDVNTDKILVVASEYSVVQYIGDGICFDGSNVEASCSGKDKYDCGEHAKCTITPSAVCDPTVTGNTGDLCANGYHLKGTDLYKCTIGDERECHKIQNVVGLFVNAVTTGEKYIKCSHVADPGFKCEALAAPQSADNSCTGRAGSLKYVEGGKDQLCITETESIKIFEADTGDYFMKASLLYEDIDNAKKFYLLDRDITSVMPKEISSSDKKYKYTGTNSQEILIRKLGQCTADNASGFLVEYTRNEDDNTYISE